MLGCSTSMLVYRRVNHHVRVVLPTCDTPSGIAPTEDPSLGHSHLASGSQGGLIVGGDRVNINGHGKNEYDTSLRNEIIYKYDPTIWCRRGHSILYHIMWIYLILLYFMYSIYDISFISLNPHDLWVPPHLKNPHLFTIAAISQLSFSPSSKRCSWSRPWHHDGTIKPQAAWGLFV